MRKETIEKVADKLMDAGNFAAAGIAITRLVSDKPFDPEMFLIGIILWMGLYGIGALMYERGGK